MTKEKNSRAMPETDESIEDKRRKNVLDNQSFLQSLRLESLRDDFKSMVTTVKEKTKKPHQKEQSEPIERRRSSRIRSMLERQPPKPIELIVPNRKKRKSIEDEDDDEDYDDEDDAQEFVVKVKSKKDREWRPSYHVVIPPKPQRESRIIRQAVKIFQPNIGLKASSVSSTKDIRHFSKKEQKSNVAISSSDED